MILGRSVGRKVEFEIIIWATEATEHQEVGEWVVFKIIISGRLGNFSDSRLSILKKTQNSL
jgi:hypothetical protein